jgi:voltage-gated potassium channel
VGAPDAGVTVHRPIRGLPTPRAGPSTTVMIHRASGDTYCNSDPMNDDALRSGPTPVPAEAMVDDPSGRLGGYLARTQLPLDLLALATLWIVVVPPGDFPTAHHEQTIALIVRLALSVIYGIDVTIRARLAARHLHYLYTHPLGVASVLVPPVRVIFSLRLLRSMFRRGNLQRFLVAASVLVANGAVIVFLVERHALHSNIHTLGDALWWSFVTVTTVGYGDYFPVTLEGRITACFIMMIGILTLAVVTAQVASSFVSQGSGRIPQPPSPEPDTSAPTLAQLDERLARMEQLLGRLSGPAEAR